MRSLGATHSVLAFALSSGVLVPERSLGIDEDDGSDERGTDHGHPALVGREPKRAEDPDARNAAADINGFRPVGDEAVVEMAPEVIVGMRRASATDAHDLSQLFALKGVQSTPAGAANRIVVMDGAYLLGFGPRVADAARDLMHALYPDIGGTGAKP